MSRKCTGEIVKVASKRPKFAGANQDVFAETEDFVYRDNSCCLEHLASQDQALFLRPPQMGKTSLLTLANVMYNKNDSQELKVAFQPADAKSMFVLSIDFLEVAVSVNAQTVDTYVKECIRGSVKDFLTLNPELQEYYEEPAATAGGADDGCADTTISSGYLVAAAKAVSRYGLSQQGAEASQSFLVLVDEYDRPVRELLLDFIGEGEDCHRWKRVKTQLQNYRNFFSSCKLITSSGFKKKNRGLQQTKVWVTGVLPIALKVISDFNPEVLTFRPIFADAMGLLDEDVDRMLDVVDSYFPFRDHEEKARVRAAIGNLANRLYFVSDTPLYHTRVVNAMMTALISRQGRDAWLQNLSVLPHGAQFQLIPPTVYDVVIKQTALRQIARDLSLNKEVSSELKENLDLGDVLRNPMDNADYLTLLVHLGIASVRQQNGETVFRATSTYFRVPFFKRLLENSLQPLFDAESLNALYLIGTDQIEQFMQSLPRSGMSSLVRWAEKKRSNSILELQFQGFLIGELANSLWSENVLVTQEDVLDSGRTDVRIAGGETVLLLELKQKPTATGPTDAEMAKYHRQLHRYMEELVQSETVKPEASRRRVAGFVVVMYNNGTSFKVDRTTYGLAP